MKENVVINRRTLPDFLSSRKAATPGSLPTASPPVSRYFLKTTSTQ